MSKMYSNPPFSKITSSSNYKTIVKLIHYGAATTKEEIIIKHDKLKNTTYEVKFDFSFRYDCSNGVTPDTISITNILKNNSGDVPEEEKQLVLKYLYRSYVNDTYWDLSRYV